MAEHDSTSYPEMDEFILSVRILLTMDYW